MNRRGKLVVFSAPSGAGKSSLIASVMPSIPSLRYSVSATTRKPRVGEVDGVHYFFLDRTLFHAMISAGEFAEWNEVHGNLYGTPRTFLDQATARGEDVVLDLDVVGKRSFDRIYPDNIGILILPPSIEELERRLRRRGTDPEEVIRIRMTNALSELAEAETGNFRHRLINDDFELSRQKLLDILRSELET
ncbi:MAG TPA: guanylate kinase [Fibrobacteria bacterium]|nr:guanylate kinase [Fibrobacteria bacterium]HOX51368.1 guanylate kinase [Fibrobacteria bacterium]